MRTNPTKLTTKSLLLLAVPVCLLAALAASTMIDPAHHIHWPTGSPGCVYAPATNTCIVPTGTLPAASAHQQLVLADSSAIGAALTEQNSEINAVFNRGLDNAFSTDVSSALTTILTSLPGTFPPTVYLPAGHYKINSGILIPCTSTTCNAISLIGAGPDSTILETDCSGSPYGIWYNNTTNSGDNFQGMRIEHLQIKATGGGACQDGIRLTQTARNVINDVKITGFSGNTYSTGTIAISGQTITGTGTTFTSAMVPGVIQVAGTMAEVCAFTSSTSLTLCSTSFPHIVSPGSAYALAWGGRAITCDPGNSYTQYISIHDAYLTGNLFGIYSMGATSGGCSRISVDGRAGWISPNPGSRIPNSVGVWLGKHSDTWDISIPINNQARCWGMDSAHANRISGECENNSTQAIVTTCNGGVAAQSCIFGAEVSADGTGTGYGNLFSAPYVYLTGVAFKVDNTAGAYDLQIIGFRSSDTSFANTANYSFTGVAGCPGNGSAIKTTIIAPDCLHTLVTGTVN